jgi:hypothetical protein
MKTQFRAPNGQSFWDLSGTRWEDLKLGCPPGHEDDCWVRWEGRDWLHKDHEDSLSEIVGYQIAQMIGLPVQPWAAFFQTDRQGFNRYPFLSGILVERWPTAGNCDPTFPVGTHADLVGKSLAMLTLDRGGDPEWLTDAEQSRFALFDLESIGPKLVWPLNDHFITVFKSDAESSYETARKMAAEVGLESSFKRNVHDLLTRDFTRAFDFSGHPHAVEIEQIVARGLLVWQLELRPILLKD